MITNSLHPRELVCAVLWRCSDVYEGIPSVPWEDEIISLEDEIITLEGAQYCEGIPSVQCGISVANLRVLSTAGYAISTLEKIQYC